jgi:hypothetical protein
MFKNTFSFLAVPELHVEGGSAASQPLRRHCHQACQTKPTDKKMSKKVFLTSNCFKTFPVLITELKCITVSVVQCTCYRNCECL